MADRPTLVVVGAATRDVDPSDARGWRLGGGVTYSSLAAARFGVAVRALVGVDAQAATAPELELLRAAGVDLRLVPIDRGPVFDNRETPAGRAQHSEGPSDALDVGTLPADWRAPAAAILAPVAGELDEGWARAFDPSTTVAVALQGLVRRLVPGGQVVPLPLRRSALVDRAQLMLISADDVAGGTPPLTELLAPGQELVVTNGAVGASYLRRDEDRLTGRYLPPMPRRRPLDATGAGDVFLGAWVAARLLLANGEPWRALAAASAMASLSVQARTLDEFPTASDLCEVLVRLRDRHLG